MTVYRYWLSILWNEGYGLVAPIVALWRAVFWETPDVLRGEGK